MKTATQHLAGDIGASVRSELVPVEGETNGTLATVARTGPEERRGCLAAALAAAIAAVRAVEKGATNAFHRYKYASADAIIAEAKEHLSANGLALVPVRLSVDGWERQGQDRFELHRQFLLLHSSGERLPLEVRWPICPEKGRPLDKATAIADTLSLSYLLRDLLLMPRIDEEPDARDTSSYQPPPPAPPSPMPAPAPAPSARPPVPGPMREEQANTISLHMKDLGIDDAKVSARLVQLGYPPDWRKLDEAQAADVVERLRQAKAQSKEAR